MSRPVVCVGAGMMPKLIVAPASGARVIISELSDQRRVCRACGWEPQTLVDVVRGTNVMQIVPSHPPIGPIDFS